LTSDYLKDIVLIQQSSINNRQSTIVNRQSTIVNRQSSINNQQSTINNQQFIPEVHMDYLKRPRIIPDNRAVMSRQYTLPSFFGKLRKVVTDYCKFDIVKIMPVKVECPDER
jgi:hypothetical protein